MLAVEHIDKESIRWSLSIIVQICGNNGQDSNLLSTDARCLVIIFCWPCSMVDFLPCDAMLSAVCAIVVCLSGCLSVCLCVYVFLKVDNFATVSGKKASNISKGSEFCLEKKYKTCMLVHINILCLICIKLHYM